MALKEFWSHPGEWKKNIMMWKTNVWISFLELEQQNELTVFHVVFPQTKYTTFFVALTNLVLWRNDVSVL